MNLTEINPGTVKKFNVVIEIPKGTNSKYEYDEKEEYFRLDRVLHSPVFYPFDYGFIPQTRSEDKDPLDVIVLKEQPTFTGCVIKCRAIGVIELEDQSGVDRKIIAVPLETVDPREKEIINITDLQEYRKKELKEFIRIYKALEPKKWTEFKGFKGKKEAEKIIIKCMKRYKEE